ncbi:uncharacterized protein LY89DRAFT_58864 [Mollisia scopiformis]|uniref:Uncharacterized protein n=1 Tax=Mollisia scopiformis TaxID=149040 RepID=A0A194XBW4_MOLSC|nr:uncharacterized protein LY89DRAFT_58864 [Mollisia scopiformis]KUJ17663.1 hypothetical protein LY89DRAFT_58864 [Mollisia scopiformis]
MHLAGSSTSDQSKPQPRRSQILPINPRVETRPLPFIASSRGREQHQSSLGRLVNVRDSDKDPRPDLAP